MKYAALNMFLLLGTVLASGCQWMAPQTRPSTIDVKSADRSTLQEGYRDLEKYTNELEATIRAYELRQSKQVAVLETQKETNRLLRDELDATTVDLEYLESKFITLDDRASREETKATAVAAMADAQILYQKLRKAESGAFPAGVWEEVDRRLSAAEAAMGRSNYTAAAYHAHRATRLLNHTERRVASFFAAGRACVVSVASANLRKRPGMNESILGQLPFGTVLVEIEKNGEWHHVKSRKGASGWVHSSVIE